MPVGTARIATLDRTAVVAREMRHGWLVDFFRPGLTPQAESTSSGLRNFVLFFFSPHPIPALTPPHDGRPRPPPGRSPPMSPTAPSRTGRALALLPVLVLLLLVCSPAAAAGTGQSPPHRDSSSDLGAVLA